MSLIGTKCTFSLNGTERVECLCSPEPDELDRFFFRRLLPAIENEIGLRGAGGGGDGWTSKKEKLKNEIKLFAAESNGIIENLPASVCSVANGQLVFL